MSNKFFCFLVWMSTCLIINNDLIILWYYYWLQVTVTEEEVTFSKESKEQVSFSDPYLSLPLHLYKIYRCHHYHHHDHHHQIFDQHAGTGATSTSVCALPGSWLAARMADLTPDLQVHVCLSWGSIAESFHSLQSLSVSCFHVILGLPGPCFPSTCMSKAVLTAPLEHSTCPY